MESVFYQSPPCIYSHVEAMMNSPHAYRQALQQIMDKGTIDSLSSSTKARVLATLHIMKEHKILDLFLGHCEVTDVAKAFDILDLPRKIRQEKHRIDVIEQAHPHLKECLNENAPSVSTTKKRLRRQSNAKTSNKRARRRKIDTHWCTIRKLQSEQCDEQHAAAAPCQKAHSNSAVQEMVTSASVSGSLARKTRSWAHKKHSADFLEFVMLTMPTDAWKKVANLVHFAPTDFKVEYFLDFVHGKDPPKDSFVAAMQELLETPRDSIPTKFSAIADRFPQVYLAYRYLRTLPTVPKVPTVAKLLAQNIPLNTAIWYLEELVQSTRGVLDIVSARSKEEAWMEVDSKVTNSFGKLLERILTFQSRGWKSLAEDLIPLAETRLSYLKEKWQSPNQGVTVVFGDASSSMTTAIRAATILASMISTTWGGELTFFSHELIESPHKNPSSVEETLEICSKIRAQGCTALAAALWPYYERQKMVDRICVVTDEMENAKCNGFMFGELLKKYMEEINPDVELILITVGRGYVPFRKGLDRLSIDYRRVEIDGVRPDLTKFDSLLGLIGSTHSTSDSNVSKEEDFVVL